MMKLAQYKDVIHKCSKCGLCQECCPMYHLDGNECATARGILILLNGIIKKEIRLTKKSIKYLDYCLKCSKCSQVCPSEIPFEDILLATKRKFLYTTFQGLLIRLGQYLLFNLKPSKKIHSAKFAKKVVYLGQNSKAVTKILNEKEIEVLNPYELSWGVEYLQAGNIKLFRKNVEFLMAKLTSLNPEKVIVDIPPEKLKSLIKTYANCSFNLNLAYLGDLPNAEMLVCKFYNPKYADFVLEKFKAKDSL